MAQNYKNKTSKPLGELATRILDPALQKKAGLNAALLIAWPDIVGQNFAAGSRPEKLIWHPQKQEAFEKATLTIACEGALSLHLQHMQDQIITRSNRLLGYGAIGRLKFVQKPITLTHERPIKQVKRLTPAQTASIKDATKSIEDDGLKAALAKLGHSILSEVKK